MFEDVFQLREKALLMDELQSLKKHRYKLTLSFNGTAGGKDFVGQKFRGVRMRSGVVKGRSLLMWRYVLTTFTAKFELRWI
jgi:hypothetical protein